MARIVFKPRRIAERINLEQEIFKRIAELQSQVNSVEYRPAPVPRIDPVTNLGLGIFNFAGHLYDGIAILGGFIFNLLRMLRNAFKSS